jgi:hypothetical protein
LVPQDDSPKLLEGEQASINVNLEVTVTADSNGHATVAFPPELRPSERLVAFLAQALKERDLELKHWRLSPEQRAELESLSNVVVKEGSGD